MRGGRVLSRRSFLHAGAAGAAGALSLALQSPEAHATVEPYAGPYLVVFNASGGWDTTYLTDPKGGPELNRLYGAGDILTSGAINYAPTASHIAAGAMNNQTFFERYGSELLVVNGIDTSVNNHSSCSRYVATGELDSRRYPTLPALIAAAKAPDVPLAFLTFGQYSATGGLIAQTRVPYLTSLRSLANSDYTDYTRSRRFHHERAAAQIESALEASLDETRALGNSEGNAATHSLDRVNRARGFVQSAQSTSQLLDRVTPFIRSDAPSDLFLQQVEIALASFASGLGVSANLNLPQFDSHNDNDAEQMRLIPKLLAGVDHLMTRAETLGLRDQLIVIIQSEMGRTPWYNQDAGKDHWSVTSMMALGAGIIGNRVIGGTELDLATGFDQSPLTVDPTTLAHSESGIRMRPEHIQQASRELLGIAGHPASLKFPLDIPPEERLVGLFG